MNPALTYSEAQKTKRGAKGRIVAYGKKYRKDFATTAVFKVVTTASVIPAERIGAGEITGKTIVAAQGRAAYQAMKLSQKEAVTVWIVATEYYIGKVRGVGAVITPGGTKTAEAGVAYSAAGSGAVSFSNTYGETDYVFHCTVTD